MIAFSKQIRFVELLTALIMMLALNGCGTVFGGLSQDIKLSSDPSNVQVLDVPTGIKYSTPATVSLKKGSAHSFVFSKAGYKNEIVPLRREARFLWWFLDSFSLGIGNLIDAGTGGLFDIKPGQVHVVLDPVKE
ncbi:MAG: hypothetical protein ABL919_09895 [Methylococcales bacterium]|nr:hypothetical protein [Methylococcaceae bacterium]